MSEEGVAPRRRWGTAVALTLAVLLLSAFDPVPMVALPLAVLLVGLPGERRWKWIALGALLWVVGLAMAGSGLGPLSRGWGLILGSTFLFATLWRPQWGVLPRALAALAVSLGATTLALGVSGGGERVDTLVRAHVEEVAEVAARSFGNSAPATAPDTTFAAVADQLAAAQWTVFPALLALQSLAALALAAWWAGRLRDPERSWLQLRPLREFRFNDQLVWLFIAGLLLLLLPAGALATRLGYNALVFMGGLYALRGVGVFVFLAGGAPSLLTVALGAVALVFLYPLVLTAALLVGLGDTWFDVRGRATLAPRA